MSEVNSKSDLPKSSYHIYHCTSPRNLNDILASGIKKSMCVNKWRRLNKYLRIVRDENEYSVGLDKRSKSVFCFCRYSDVANTDSKNSVFAIDTRELNQPMYRASYHKVTKVHEIVASKSAMSVRDIFESRFMDAESKELYKTAKKYWDNMEEEKPPIEKGGEILIDGDVSSSAITHYVR